MSVFAYFYIKLDKKLHKTVVRVECVGHKRSNQPEPAVDRQLRVARIPQR
jgi:hypothetical protein